jgi:hypothetical protein
MIAQYLLSLYEIKEPVFFSMKNFKNREFVTESKYFSQNGENLQQ